MSVSFFSPIYSNVNHCYAETDSARRIVTHFFNFGQKAYTISSQFGRRGKILVKEISNNPTWFGIAWRIVAIATIIIPLIALIGLEIYRSQNRFYLRPIEIRPIPVNPNPDPAEEDEEEKLPFLGPQNGPWTMPKGVQNLIVNYAGLPTSLSIAQTCKANSNLSGVENATQPLKLLKKAFKVAKEISHFTTLSEQTFGKLAQVLAVYKPNEAIDIIDIIDIKHRHVQIPAEINLIRVLMKDNPEYAQQKALDIYERIKIYGGNYVDYLVEISEILASFDLDKANEAWNRIHFPRKKLTARINRLFFVGQKNPQEGLAAIRGIVLGINRLHQRYSHFIHLVKVVNSFDPKSALEWGEQFIESLRLTTEASPPGSICLKICFLRAIGAICVETNPIRASQLFEEAIRLANSLEPGEAKDLALYHIAVGMRWSNPDDALGIANKIGAIEYRIPALRFVAIALDKSARLVILERALELANSVESPYEKALAQFQMVKSFANFEKHEGKALEIANSIELNFEHENKQSKILKPLCSYLAMLDLPAAQEFGQTHFSRNEAAMHIAEGLIAYAWSRICKIDKRFESVKGPFIE